MRRWALGDEFTTQEGIRCRIRHGKKKPRPNSGEDYVLDLWVNERWVPLRMPTIYKFADFLYENEDSLYPPPNNLGGEMFLNSIKTAVSFGHQAATDKLSGEQSNKRSRELFDEQQLSIFESQPRFK